MKWRPQTILCACSFCPPGPWQWLDPGAFVVKWKELPGLGLSQRLVVTETDCGKCAGKRDLLGSEWEGLGVFPVSERCHSVQNSTQGMGKVFASQPVPLLLCTFVYFSLWKAMSVLLQLLQR